MGPLDIRRFDRIEVPAAISSQQMWIFPEISVHKTLKNLHSLKNKKAINTRCVFKET